MDTTSDKNVFVNRLRIGGFKRRDSTGTNLALALIINKIKESLPFSSVHGAFCEKESRTATTLRGNEIYSLKTRR